MATEKVTRQVFDIDAFENINLVKTFEFEPVASVESAIEKYQGSEDVLLRIIQAGERNEVRNAAYKDMSGYHTFKDEDSGEINGLYTGKPVNPKDYRDLVNSLSRALFGYDANGTVESKRAAKKNAQDLIKNTPSIKAGLQAKAAAVSTTVEESEDSETETVTT